MEDYDWKPFSKAELIAWLVFYAFTLWMYRPNGTPYLDAVHLVTHEAGHPLFGYLGNYVLTIAGGTILQLLVPLLLTITFFHRRHVTGTAFCAFMFFNSWINVGTYMADARAHVLTLVAPGMSSDEIVDHDWTILFEQANLIRHDVQIGNAVRAFGFFGMILVVGWLVFMWFRLREDS